MQSMLPQPRTAGQSLVSLAGHGLALHALTSLAELGIRSLRQTDFFWSKEKFVVAALIAVGLPQQPGERGDVACQRARIVLARRISLYEGRGLRGHQLLPGWKHSGEGRVLDTGQAHVGLGHVLADRALARRRHWLAIHKGLGAGCTHHRKASGFPTDCFAGRTQHQWPACKGIRHLIEPSRGTTVLTHSAEGVSHGTA